MRWKAALLTPLLTVALLAQTAPMPAQAAVTSCTAGGSVTVTTVTSEGTVSLVISCTGTQLASSGKTGTTSTQTYYNTTPCNTSVVGSGAGNCTSLNNTYCAGSAGALDRTYWMPLTVVRSTNNFYQSWAQDTSGSIFGGSGAYPGAVPYYYTVRMAGNTTFHNLPGFSAAAAFPGSVINANNALSGSDGSPITVFSYSDIVEVNADAYGITGGAVNDPGDDAAAQREILGGPVYNKLNLTGSTWTGGSSAYYTYTTTWGITGYTSLKVLVTAGYWTNMDLTSTDWANGSYTSYYWMDWFGANRPTTKPTPGSGAGAPSAWPAYWKYEINGESSYDGYNFTWPKTPAWVAPVYTTVKVPIYGWITTATLNKGKLPTCHDGTWTAQRYLSSTADATDDYIWPSAIKISNPPVAGLIPSSWTNLGALSSSVVPGSFKQIYGQYNIQVVGAPFPYAMSGQSYTGAPIVKTLTVVTTDPNTGVQFVVTLVGTVGLTGVKWDWGDGTQSLIPGALGLGSCSPQPPTQPWCDPTHTPTHAGNGKVNAWEYYGSDIWEFYYDPVQGGVVSKDLGSGTSGYLGCPSDPNPSYRPGGSSFCLTPTPSSPGTPETVPLANGGYPYSVGQVEGLPGS
jgi:hypothetical protein